MSEIVPPTKRSRGRPRKVIADVSPLTAVIIPATPAPTPLPAPTPIPVSAWAECAPQLHAIIQGSAGQYRGVLAQIGEIKGQLYRCYIIGPNNSARQAFEISAADCVVIGKPRVAARNPFPEPATPDPVADESQVTFDDRGELDA